MKNFERYGFSGSLLLQGAAQRSLLALAGSALIWAGAWWALA